MYCFFLMPFLIKDEMLFFLCRVFRSGVLPGRRCDPVVASLVGASVSQGAYTDESAMSIQQRMASNVGEKINSVGSQITRKNLDIQPTLKILAGKKVHPVVSREMVFKPYEETG
jgi:hypothetical protein